MSEQQEKRATEHAASLPGSTTEREPSHYETAMHIADRLGETEEGVRTQLVRIVGALGRTQARALLEETLRIEESGGMLLPDGSRRRTIGGIYFHLAYTTGISKSGKKLRRPASQPAGGQQAQQSPQAAPSKQPKTVPPLAPPFNWDDRLAVMEEIGGEKGKATTVKITLIGTLGKYVEKGTFVAGVMQHTGEKLPALPKGVPAPQAVKTNYLVYIAMKQWKTVVATVNDPEDALIIEGFPQIDTKTGTISVFASNVTSKKLQSAKRQSQDQKSG